MASTILNKITGGKTVTADNDAAMSVWAAVQTYVKQHDTCTAIQACVRYNFNPTQGQLALLNKLISNRLYAGYR